MERKCPIWKTNFTKDFSEVKTSDKGIGNEKIQH